MPVTALLVFQEANAQTINQVKGAIYPIFPTEVPETWGFEYKLFRENPDSSSSSQGGVNDNTASSHLRPPPAPKQSRFLTHLILNHHRGNIYVQTDPQPKQQQQQQDLIKKEEEDNNNNNNGYNPPPPPPPIVTMEPGFDLLVTRKMQSLWLLRQTLRGDGGIVYSCNDGMFWLRIVTVTQNGSAFKMLIMEIECTPTTYLNDGKSMIQSLLQNIPELPPYKIIYGDQNDESNSLDAKSNSINEFTHIQTVQQYFTVFRSRY